MAATTFQSLKMNHSDSVELQLSAVDIDVSPDANSNPVIKITTQGDFDDPEDTQWVSALQIQLNGKIIHQFGTKGE